MLKPHPVEPREIKAFLRVLCEADVVLIGGQGVNIWSCIYEKPDSEPWRSSRPYTSVDADVLADRAEMVRLARRFEQARFQVNLQIPRTDEERSVNTGLIEVRKEAVELGINLVPTVLGVSAQDLRSNAVSLVWEEVPVRVIHPVMCVESKAHNLLRLPQDNPEAPRQDKKHLRLSIANLREHLLRRSTPELAAPCLQIARRLVDLGYQEPGRDVLTRHQIDVLEGIPWQMWRRQALPELREFAAREPEFRSEIQARIEADAEIAQWIKKLKDRSK